ncbi:MAG: hypothetical protein Q9163_003107 [Psora crenata]
MPFQYNHGASAHGHTDAYVRRTPSFDRGDDNTYSQTRPGTTLHSTGYVSTITAATQNHESQMNPQSPPYPLESTAYGAGATNGYPYQGDPPGPPPRSSYNPQQYGAPLPPYSPQPNNSFPSNYKHSFQSYNPAAYHPAGQPNFQTYISQPTSGFHSPSQPPPPPRSYGQNYGNPISPALATNSQFSTSTPPLPYRQQTSSALPSSTSISGPPYHPLATLPAPLSSMREAYATRNSPSTNPGSYTSFGSPSETPQSCAEESLTAQNSLPPLPSYSSDDSQDVPPPLIHRKPVGGNNSLSLTPSSPQTPGTPGPIPPVHSLQHPDAAGRHPQARPLPGPPQDAAVDSDFFGNNNEDSDGQVDTQDQGGYDALMQEVEAAVMRRPPRTSSQRGHGAALTHTHSVEDETGSFYSPSGERNSYSHANGDLGQIGEEQYGYDAYSDNSDAEAEAGLAAMHLADEQDAADAARRQSGAIFYQKSPDLQQSMPERRDTEGSSSDSDVPVDMSTYGGGFSGGYHYGDETTKHGLANSYDDQDRSFNTTYSSQQSDVATDAFAVGHGLYDHPSPGQQHIHLFAPARVDTGGTGGLSEPDAHLRRLSFEDGDEATLADTVDPHPSEAPIPLKDGLPEMFFYPSSTSGRPLPAAPMDQMVPQLMPAGTYRDPERVPQLDEHDRPRFPIAPDAYNQLLTPSGTPVPRSSSLISHGSHPQAFQPIRSKTDADRARILKQQQSGYRSASIYGTDAFGNAAINPSAELLDLPAIPAGKRRKFNPAKLSTSDYQRCPEPWALSSILAWLKEMSEGEADLKEHAVIDGIVNLFTHKVPTMNTADAEALGAKVVSAMLDSGTLIKDEEWVKFGSENLFGVLFQLTGTGCYSSRVHTETLPGRCYAHHCMRTLKKINLQTQVLEPQRKVEDWATFYKIKKEDIANVDRKEIERQNNLHEIVTTEDTYMDQLNVLRVLYRDELAKWQPPIIGAKRRDQFLKDVFGKADAVKQVNEDYLLAQLKYRQHEQGPWIVGFSDIFREWIRKAKSAYTEYAASFPNATFLIRQEADRNILFRQFLDQARENERSKRLGWDTYLKAPITRLQRYGLLLSTVYKHMTKESEEKSNLAAAMEEIRVVTMECDAKVAEMSKSVDLSELAVKLKLRPGMENVNLHLTHLGREVIFRGDLQRMGSAKFSWVDSHAILFDHYFVLAKVVDDRHPSGGAKGQKYDVSKLPIPMDLLVLESTDDDPVIKSTMKGLGSVTTVTSKAGGPNDNRGSRQSASNTSIGPDTLAHTDSASSIASTKSNGSSKTLVASVVVESSRDEKIMYPFRIRHLGRSEVYVLYAPTKQNRQEWYMKIVEAKTRHAASLYKQNAEPFRLRVIADTAFAYDAMTGSGKSIVIRGTPLNRAIREAEQTFKGTGPRPNPVCRAAVNCATAFTHPNGTAMVAIGTDYGVYTSEYDNPRGWLRVSLVRSIAVAYLTILQAITATRVTQIAVLEDFSIFLILADKTLIAYHLDTVLPNSTNSSHANNVSSSSRRAPQKLSGARDIGFFAHGRMKDRQLIFYKKKEGVSSIFKVLEPVYQRSPSNIGISSIRSRLGGVAGRKGTTELFRDFDEFYIPSETYAINLFHSSLAIATARGIEVLNLDKKVPFSIPDLKPPDCASIASRLRDQRPLGMFRLSDSEFLLVFEEVGIYVNKHGDVSRSVIMEYVGKAKQACLVGAMYLILVDCQGGFVEVRNAINGRLRQIISGRDVRLLDDGGGRKGTVKICMQHPEWERTQIVVEMIVNEGLKE